jgi:hypothetical protein
MKWEYPKIKINKKEKYINKRKKKEKNIFKKNPIKIIFIM